MPLPIVSVIIPTFGPTTFLNQAIDSVFEQTFTDLEMIIVDDNGSGSPFRTETEEIVRRNQAQGREIIYIQHDENKNGAAARNSGILRSSGKYISFLDADDFYCPTHLEEAVAIMDRSTPNFGGVYAGVEFRRRGKTYGAFRNPLPGNFLVETLACTFKLGTGSNLFIRRNVIEELEGFDEAFWRHQDYEFMVRFFKKYDLAASNSVSVKKNNENLNLPNFPKSLDVKQKYIEKYRDLIETLPKSDQDYIIRSNYIWLGEMALRDDLRHESKRMYFIASQHGYIGIKNQVRRFILCIRSYLN